MQIFAKKKHGFTLIELLVVIAIIGILAGIVLVSLGGARQKARNAARQSDIRQVITAMEMYYSDNNEAYSEDDATPTAIGEYLATFPTDPGPGSLAYGWINNCADNVAPCAAAAVDSCTPGDQNQCFCVYATMETNPVTYFAGSHKGTKTLIAVPTLQDCW